MTQNLAEQERQRRAWRRARENLKLVDVESDDFAASGLGARVPDLSVRLLVLPSDPETTIVEFDGELWQWWVNLPSEVEGRTIDWGHERRATATAMVRHDRASDDPWQWSRYLGLHRNGALEFGLGRVGAREWNGARIFFLINVLGRTWASLAQYRAVIERLEVRGPWEVTLSLIRTHGSYLGNLAEGWAEPQNLDEFERVPCVERNVLIRYELAEWPATAEAVRDLALIVGGRLEDSWGFHGRRFLARQGANEGMFDVSRL